MKVNKIGIAAAGTVAVACIVANLVAKQDKAGYSNSSCKNWV